MGHLPPNAAAVAQLIEQRLAARLEKTGEQRTLTVDFRGQPEILSVVSLPVDSLMLNPDTHRIRAQKSLDPVREKALEDDPYGEMAQGYLQHLLTRDPVNPENEDTSFKELRESLDEYGQEEPGIVTRAGVLINANTRCVALRELGKREILVAVLPSDAAEADTEAIELVLQLRKEHKRDYSFVNALLAVDDRVARGDDPTAIQKDFRMRAETYKRSIWILNLIRDAIDRSRVQLKDGTEVKMRLVDFETHQGKLEELHRAWSKLERSGQHDRANRLLEQRLLAIVMDKSKTDVRLIDEDFLKNHAAEVLPPGDFSPTRINVPGVPGGLQVAGPSSETQRVSMLTDSALKARAVRQTSTVATPDEVRISAARLVELDSAIENGLTTAGKNARLKKTHDAPIQSLEDATEDLRAAISAIAGSKAARSFDPEELDSALQSFKRELTRLAQHVKPAVVGGELSEGVGWLFKAVTAS